MRSTEAAEAAQRELLGRWNDGGRVWLLSDFHGNGPATRAALERAGGCADVDAVAFLGDLLTYGCHPEQVIADLELWTERIPVVWIRGNHDEIYESLDRGEEERIESLPAWIRESIAWTRERVDSFLSWGEVDELDLGSVLLSHANPFGPGDWSYLNREPELLEAVARLRSRGFKAGFFGHTHRPILFRATSKGSERRIWRPGETLSLSDAEVVVANVGSIGQPRGDRRISTIGWLRRRDQGFAAGLEEVPYDLARHLEAIDESGMSRSTRERLRSFFEPLPGE